MRSRARAATAFLPVLALAVLLSLASCTRDGDPDDPDRGAAGGGDERAFKVVPLLVARPSGIDGRGTAMLDPADPVAAGSRQTWNITYTAEEPGIGAGGFVLLQVSLFWGWSSPQTSHPGLPGHVSVSCSAAGAAYEAAALEHSRVIVRFAEPGLAAGESVTFTYANAVADRFAEAEELFQILVDADGDGHAATVPSSPRIRILPRDPVQAAVNLPCQAHPKDEVVLSLAGLDAAGNWAPFAKDAAATARILLNGAVIETLELELERGGRGKAGGGTEPAGRGLVPRAFEQAFTLPDQEGICVVEVAVQVPGGTIEASSNPLLCRAGERTLNLYFGDIHGHTRLSDGTGTPEDYFAFARQVARLDVAALTDHDSYGTFPIEGPPWERIKAATAAAHEPGEFVTFLGYEWTNWEFGHRNVYFRGDDGEIFSAIEERSRTPEGLWQCLEPYDAMTVAHHTGGGPVPIDWSHAPGPKEWLVEICSVHGSSEQYGGRASIYNPVRGAFVFDALNRGYRLGLIGSGDTHDGHPGHRSVGAPAGGLLGVFAEELTREAVWEAFRRRHTYATSGPKIILFARVADAPMGSEVVWERDAVPVSVMAAGCGELEAIEVVRNGRTEYHHACAGRDATLLIEDSAPPAGSSWYVVKVVQKDGNMAWSSPVWVTR